MPVHEAASLNSSSEIILRPAVAEDLQTLCAIEEQCFSTDRLTKRSFRHHLQSPQSVLWVGEVTSAVPLAYGLCLLHKGTRLARLYSLAVIPAARGQGLAPALISALEQQARDRHRLYMRLEVAENNHAAIKLYESVGYRAFGEYLDYYEDHADAVRMQKTIRGPASDAVLRATPWYQQTTDFTCGPAALMMAMVSLNPQFECTQTLELSLWREATTIFMTSGHGGCHPFGLALAAHLRGFEAQVWVNSEQPLFLEGVRSEAKKAVLGTVHNEFFKRCQEQGVRIENQSPTQNQLEQWLKRGMAVLVLISTYRLDGRKVPHWVLVTGFDEECFYVHDPDVDEKLQLPMDCQHVPIARDDFDKMSVFGSQRLRTAVVLATVG